MSLHKFAEQVAAQGRGDDSLLVHMTPEEVRNLQKFAEANGTTLTINPTTGLPEAGLLSDLFKAVAPIALGAFLGPGAFGIAGMGLSAGMAGAVAGGITTLATGSLSRGLMAGLGAYGGAGMAEGLAGAGAAELGKQAVASTASELMNAGAGEALTGEAYNQAMQQGVTNRLAAATPASTWSAGMEAVKAAPMDFAKQNLGNLAYAASPILAGAMVPTTTKLPEVGQNTGYIRQQVFDPGTQTFRSLTPVKANEWKDKSFSDIYRGYAGGGIVALAGGGVSDQQVKDWFLANQGASDIDIANAMQQYQVGADQIARATGTQGQEADYNSRFVQAITTPATTTAQFQTAAQNVGLQDQALANAMQNSGMSQAAQYASTHALQDTGGVSGTDLYKNMGYTAGALPGDEGGLKGLYANINYVAQGLQNQINSGAMTPEQARAAALAEMNRVGVSSSDISAATGKSLNDLFRAKTIVDDQTTDKTEDKKVVNDGSGVVAGGTKLDTATTYDNGAYGNYGSGNKTATDYLGNTVSIATPGDIITNPDMSRTIVPNIAGRPYGGFTGLDQVKSAYTAGGGSLGYTAKAPRTIDEFNQMYNKQTGDSMAAYNYLMGQGAYPVSSGVGQIAKPYREAVLKYPVNTNKAYNYDAATGQMVRNPDYIAPMRDASGNVTYGMSLNDVKKYLTEEPLTGQALYDWVQKNNLSAQDIADATGRPLSSIYAEFRAAQQNATKPVADKTAADTTSTQQISDGLAMGGVTGYAVGGGLGSLGSYSDGGRLLRGPGDGVSDSIPATIGAKGQPARLADGEFVVPARIVSELGNGSTEAGAKKLYAMMDRVQRARGKTTGKNKVAANSRADKYLPA